MEDGQLKQPDAIWGDFVRYVYYACLPNIRARLDLKLVSGRAATFRDALASVDVSTVTPGPYQYSELWDETMLATHIYETLRRESPLPMEDGPNPETRFIQITTETAGAVFAYFVKMLLGVVQIAGEVDTLRCAHPTAREGGKLTSLLEELEANLGVIYNLVFMSRLASCVFNSSAVYDALKDAVSPVRLLIALRERFS